MTAYGIVGHGRAARSLAPLIDGEPGDELRWWYSRGDPADPRGLAPVDVVILAVPDGAIEAAAAALAPRPAAAREIWLHLSGSRPGTVARATPTIPHAVGCMHPMVALTGRADRALLAGATAGIDGEPEAVAHARTLASALGLVPQTIDGDDKALYHAAAVTVAGHAVALCAQAIAMLEAAGFDATTARGALVPLMRTAIAHLADRAPEEAITGPLTRGDVATVRRHLEALDELGDGELASTYRALARRALSLSAPRLDPADVAALEALTRS